MSFRNLTPLAKTSLLFAQTGSMFLTKDHGTVTGDAGGHSGSGSQDYLELLAGKACGSYTSKDNTTGTKYYPEIQYFTSIKNYSYNVFTGDNIELEVSANSLIGDNLSKNTGYDPDNADTAYYIHIYHGDQVYGKFDKISIFKLANSSLMGRALITRGPSLN